jgi:hypothetical protein
LPAELAVVASQQVSMGLQCSIRSATGSVTATEAISWARGRYRHLHGGLKPNLAGSVSHRSFSIKRTVSAW